MGLSSLTFLGLPSPFPQLSGEESLGQVVSVGKVKIWKKKKVTPPNGNQSSKFYKKRLKGKTVVE